MLNIKHSTEIKERYPLTDTGEGIYLECIASPESVMYSTAMRATLPSGISPVRFADAVKRVAEAHPSLFTVFVEEGGRPCMKYKRCAVTVEQTETDDIEKKEADFLRPFDLANGPLFRFELCRCGEKLYFFFDVHHLVFDGHSVNLFVRQVAEAYGTECEIVPEELSLYDIAEYGEKKKTTAEYAEAREFFKSRLSEHDTDSRPVSDRVGTVKETGAGEVGLSSEGYFGKAEVDSFRAECGVREGSFFISAFAYALAAFNGANECTFCTANHGRNDERMKNSTGMFVRTLPLYYDIDNSSSVRDYLTSYGDILLQTMKNGIISFSELAENYGVDTAVSFVYQGDSFSAVPIGGGEMKIHHIPLPDISEDIRVMVYKQDELYTVSLLYKKEKYTEEMMTSLSRLFFLVAGEMMKKEKLSDIMLCDGIERELTDKFNETKTDYDRRVTVVDMFRESAKKYPDRTAVVYEDRRYTYREVDEMTDRLAAHLKGLGIGKEKVVGILIPRCEYMPISALGTLKAGGAYMPLDPTYPPERLNLMMEDSGASLLITTPELSSLITDGFKGHRMMTQEIPELPANETELLSPSLCDLFILLYTSGSTGKPKGVMYEHRNTVATVNWVGKYFGINETSKVTAYASFGFDANVFDTYPALVFGAELHIISDDIRLDLLALRDYFNKNGITHAVMTTQIGRQFALLGGFETLCHLSVAGEKLTPLPPPEGFKMYNLYGPTEGTVVTSRFLIDGTYRDVPIGKAVDDMKLYVVDKCGRLLPPGGVGELYISGPHVTRGYLKRPDKTAEAYGENPFSDDAEYGRIYRTGDIVRLLHDGNLQFVGRKDAQVKVRGFRVELTEIEEVIRRFDGIRDATVAAFDDPAGGKFVAAYIVSDVKIDTSVLCDFIGAQKPPYMVPAVIMQIDKIPLNQNHKVDKKALPVPEREAEELKAPKDGIETEVFSVVAEVIGHEKFGADSDLYRMGLTSIGSVRLNVALAGRFGVPVKISEIKEYNTVEKLARLILSKSDTAEAGEYEIQQDYPLSQTQSGIFVECMSAPGTTAYNMPLLLRLDSSVDTDKLADALRTAVNAHPYLKARLTVNGDGDIRAMRNDSEDAAVTVIDCDRLPEEKELVYPFTLTNSPLYRITVFRTEDGNYLFTDIHHIINDGASQMILLRDTSRAYDGEALETEKYTGFEFALDEEKAREGAEYDAAKEYYKKLLSGIDTECLPAYSPECEGDGTPGKVIIRSGLDINLVERFCGENSVTPNSFFNSVFSFVLARFIYKDEVVYTTVYNGRSDSRTNDSISMFVKTIPVTADISGDKKVSGFVSGIRSQLIDSMSHDIYSFAEISRECGVSSDIIFIYQGSGVSVDTVCSKPATQMILGTGAAKAPIAVNVYLENGEYVFDTEYRRDMYSGEFIRSMTNSFISAANSFTESEYIRDITMMTEGSEEQYAILNEKGDIPFRRKPAFTLFREAVRRHPQKTAGIANGERITFAELEEKSNRVANALISLGAGGDTVVGIVLDRTVDVFICEIGIMKSGGAFLPMLPTYPRDRIEFCLTDSGSPYLLTTEAVKAAHPELFSADETEPYKVLTVEELLCESSPDAPDYMPSPSDMAYCIYTSGSTGRPKGVMIEHHNFSNFIDTHRTVFKEYSDEDDGGCAMAISSISFDMSLYEIYIPMFHGKTVVMATEKEIHDPLGICALMRENNVEMMTCTPTFMMNMLTIPEYSEEVARLRAVTVGAEAFPAVLYDNLKKLNPDITVVNGYGPTECTVCCSVKELKEGKNITIGRPTGNCKMFVLDKCGHILPQYAAGELIICGECVGRGYVKLPEKSAASFFTLKGIPAYHSGDLVRLGKNAEIEFTGRIDNQVKLRGFRVELDEIEKVISSFEGVRQSKVVVRNNGSEDYLVGFFTAEGETDIGALTDFIKTKLTYYMVPAVLMQLSAMPLTQNGKIDKSALPEVTNTVRRKEKRAPKKSLEAKLCDMFGSILKLDEYYADDDFFEMGGTSLTASKITMLLMAEDIKVEYGDIFDNPTPASLAEFIEQNRTAQKPSKPDETDNATDEALRYNTLKYVTKTKREPLGNTLLTGAVGYLGIHVLKELIDKKEGRVICLVRQGEHASCKSRLAAMMMYYFGEVFTDALENTIDIVDADITDDGIDSALEGYEFETVINCAALVKHFANDDILNTVNVGGVKNLIALAKKRGARLVQISTASIPGVHTEESYAAGVKMHENELFTTNVLENKYVTSKFNAEKLILEAVRNGMRGKIIRVGNLMGRHSDGEFQVNYNTNMFMQGIRGFATVGKVPMTHMTDPMRLSPVDCTAKAVVLLAGTGDKFTAFNAENRYGFDEMKIIDACNRCGITIIPTEDPEYYEEYNRMLGDEKVNGKLNGLAAYDRPDLHMIEADNLFTTNVLYRLGFSWPLVDDAYLDRIISALKSLGYFDPDFSD